MDAAQFRVALSARGLTQSSFARRVEMIGGEKLPLRTVQSWALGESRIPAVVPALLVLMPPWSLRHPSQHPSDHPR